jgi:hypothetical protein
VLEHAPSRPTREELWPLGEGARLFPQDAALAYKAATLFRESGYGEEAAAIVGRARGFARTEKDRALLASFSPDKAR